MQVQFAFVCREAIEEGDGLLTLRGFPLATVTRSTLPSVLPPSVLLIGLRYGSEDAGLRDITLSGSIRTGVHCSIHYRPESSCRCRIPGKPNSRV